MKRASTRGKDTGADDVLLCVHHAFSPQLIAHRRIAICSALLVVLLAGCAVKAPLSGGPRDTTPPTIEASTPASGTTRMADDEVTIRFSSYVDRGVTTAVVVQPAIRIKTTYAGDEITVRFVEPLAPNTTYALSLGTSWADVRGNKPTEAYTIIFSTGTQIDTGRIGGKVSAPSAENVMVFCHPIDVDTLYAPRTTPAKYRLPVGASGTFRFDGLRDGRYRVLAVRDANRNGMVDANEDVGTASSDVTVLNGQASAVALALAAAKDRVPPLPMRARSTHAHDVQVTFSERIDSSHITPSDITILDSMQAPVEAVAAWIPSDKRDLLVIRTRGPMSAGRHTVAVAAQAVRDSAGLAMPDTTRPLSFQASSVAFAYRPSIITISVADSAKRVPTDKPIIIRLSEALRDTTQLTCTVTQADAMVPARLVMRSPAQAEVVFDQPLTPSAWYRLTVNLGADTTIVRTFQTADRVDPGAFTLTVIDSARIAETYLLRILDDRGGVVTTRQVRTGTDSVTVAGLPPATYSLDVVVDANRNGLFDAGDVDPWIPGETRIPLDIKVQVRPRWTVEGLRVAIPTK